MKVMLAKKYDDQNPVGWLMSEKLDGVRAIWTGDQLISRNGNVFNAPDWFIAALPKDVVLDGELWEGREMFQTTVGKVRSKCGDWSSIKFMLFDVISSASSNFRQTELLRLSLPAHCSVVAQVECRGKKHLKQFEEMIHQVGGEGVMLKNPRAAYHSGRCNDLLKVKRFSSAEARVIGHEAGTGKNASRLGALVVNFMGHVFRVGTGIPDFIRDTPPVIGSQVTFSYCGCTDAGIPRFPVFLAERDYE